jgi:protein ImuB
MYACLHAPGNLPLLVECARGFSPHIEENPPDSALFDVRGLEALHGPPLSLAREIERRAGVKANVAIAPNPDAALHAARGIAGITVIETGKEAAALAKLPINLLGGAFHNSEIAETLHLWGIRTFGDFAKLPPLGVAARLGDAGIELQRLARGEGYRRLRPLEDPLEFEAERELEYPVDLLEPLAFVMARLLKEICERLASRALATNEIRLKLALENAPQHETSLRLPVPMLDQKAFLRMLQLDLSGRPPIAPVVKVHMAAEPVKPRRTQQGLFVPSSPEPEKLELTVARVRHLVGADRVGSPEISNTHRPDAFALRAFAPRAGVSLADAAPELPRLCLRRFRPPRYAQVLVVNRRPVRVISPAIGGRVAMAKGPWRTSGEWWREDAWNRDEWDVALESGGVYRIYRENDSERWFVEGSYD